MHDVAGEQLGRVIVAQRVLEAVVEMTALTVPGIVRTAPYGRRTVHLRVEGNGVYADIGIIVAVGEDVAEVSATCRRTVAAAIERLLGMEAKEVNVFVRDVENALTPHLARPEMERDSER
ncbi:MAG: Asp23/Gls24 family envelope stress response protein [Thermomicrobiales bacterium]